MGVESEEKPSEDSVEADFDTIRRKAGVRSCMTKWVTRNYAFDDSDIPRGENTWLKVVYGFDRELLLPSSSTTLEHRLRTPNIA